MSQWPEFWAFQTVRTNAQVGIRMSNNPVNLSALRAMPEDIPMAPRNKKLSDHRISGWSECLMPETLDQGVAIDTANGALPN